MDSRREIGTKVRAMFAKAPALAAIGLTGLVLFGCPPKKEVPAAPPDSGVASKTGGEVGMEGPGLPAPADVAAPPADAEKTVTGLMSKVIKTSTVPSAEQPEEQDTVRVHYTGWTTDGKMFDSSVTRGQPAMFPLRNVIPGWTEGLQLMKTGEKRRFWIPEDLAYKGRPGAPAGMLVFEVELLDIARGPKPVPAPADVAAPPADAQKTTSGIHSKVITPGTGKKKPNPEDTVKVHYTGWTTNGKMFDTSITRGEPVEFPLNRVIPGWTEGVGLMVVGEKRRLWIPEELAYKGKPGAPQGMLVFDVELLDVKAGEKPIAAPADVKAPREGRQEDRERPRVQGPQEGQRQGQAGADVDGRGALHGLDHRREDVRQLRPAEADRRVPSRPGHPGLDRGRRPDDEGREDALLDPGRARVQGHAGRAAGHAGLRSRAPRHQGRPAGEHGLAALSWQDIRSTRGERERDEQPASHGATTS